MLKVFIDMFFFFFIYNNAISMQLCLTKKDQSVVLRLKHLYVYNLQKVASADGFAKKLLEMRNGKLAIDESTQFITLPTNFCKIIAMTKELIDKVFPNLTQNYRNRQWLGTRAILVAKNYDVSKINISILKEIPGSTTTYQLMNNTIEATILNRKFNGEE